MVGRKDPQLDRCRHPPLKRLADKWEVTTGADRIVKQQWEYAGGGRWGDILCCRWCGIAIKLVAPEDRGCEGHSVDSDFEPEIHYNTHLARMCADLGGEHPYIVKFFGCVLGAPRRSPLGRPGPPVLRGLVFAYGGKDLSVWIRSQRHRQYLKKWWVDIVTQLAIGVEFLHSQGILHGDLKPANILVRSSPAEDVPPRAKICDLGLACEPRKPRTTHGMICTCWYRPPEIRGRNDPYTLKVDVWSIGCIVVELMTGVPLFKVPPGLGSYEKNNEALKELHGQWTPPTLESCRSLCPDSELYAEVVRGTLNADPAKRWTVVELVQVLVRGTEKAGGSQGTP